MSSQNSPNTTTIAVVSGTAAGGMVLGLLIAFVVWFCKCRRQSFDVEPPKSLGRDYTHNCSSTGGGSECEFESQHDNGDSDHDYEPQLPGSDEEGSENDYVNVAAAPMTQEMDFGSMNRNAAEGEYLSLDVDNIYANYDPDENED